MPRRFNITGDCRPDWHYMVPPIPRLPEAPKLVEQMGYFMVHAPQPTGKTTTLKALAKELTASGKYAALYFSCETGEAAQDDYAAAERILLHTIDDEARRQLPEGLRPPPFPKASRGKRVLKALAAWARACPRPLVLVFDEIDALRGQSLLSVLRQFRAGFSGRPTKFPASVILCGLRGVRDYKAASGGDPTRLGTASPFNVKIKSLKLGDFDRSDVGALYAQHSADTGQIFTKDALDRVMEVTGGGASICSCASPIGMRRLSARSSARRSSLRCGGRSRRTLSQRRARSSMTI